MDIHRGDRGSIVIGWLGKLAVVLALVGVALFDGLSVTAARLGAQDDASTAATAAATAYRDAHTVQAAYDAAVASLPSDAETIPARTFTVTPDGSVHLQVRRTARTVVLAHIGPLAHYATIVVSGDASPAQL